MTTPAPETKNCPYCGWVFAITPRHRDERVYPYCSHGCRIAMEERHVAFEERHIELREEITAAELPPDHEIELAVLADLPPAIAERLREFLRQWLQVGESTREIIAQRVSGRPYWVAGELQAISKQAAHKSAKKAARLCPVLATALGMPSENPVLNPPPPVALGNGAAVDLPEVYGGASSATQTNIF